MLALVLLRHDLRAQYRYGIVAALLIATLAYALALRLLAPVVTEDVAAFILYTEPSVLGFFLVGGISILEATEGGKTALGMTPARPVHYVIAKILSLSLLCAAAAFVIALFGGLRAPAALLPITALVAGFNTALGIALAERFSTVTSYLFGGGLVLTLILLPGFSAFLDAPDVTLWWPSAAHIHLLLSTQTTEAASPHAWTGASFGALAATVIAVRSLRGRFGGGS